MKLYPFILLALIASQAAANEQYSAYHCKTLKAEKERIQERFAKGYGVAEGNYLNDRDRELFQIMRRHCVKPIQSNQSVPSITFSDDDQPNQPFPNSSYDSSAINDNWSAQNRVYQGEKLKSWETFYKMPAKCRQKSPQHDDFVFCADDKAQQKKAFEQYWRNRVKVN